ncbi:MAG: hypothetical protein QGH45_18345, partial [Myxococcota bacterium]|nr:hypothetical protein [Myxococcota bacterium]
MSSAIRTVPLLLSLLLLACPTDEPGEFPFGGLVGPYDADRAWPSYMLYSGVENGGAYLIDMDANVVHQWTADHEARVWGYAELRDDGRVVTVTSG